MKVYITKYALGEGIIEAEGHVPPGSPGYLSVDSPSRWKGLFLGPNDWHTTEEDAHSRVLDMVATAERSTARKLAALVKLRAKHAILLDQAQQNQE